MDRKIPVTMASQHPDHAGVPYWHSKEFISTRQEVKECFLAFSDLGIDEYKWDWEGKYVDESVLEKLLSSHFEYFAQHPLGKEKFITFRLPNPKVETEFRLGRAFMGILSASALAKQLGLYPNPLFEVILPMTETAQEMIAIQEAFAEVASLKHALYSFSSDTIKHITIIPLFETINSIVSSDAILHAYTGLHEKTFGIRPTYIRPYVARSDPALNSGMVPTVLAIQIALSRYGQFMEETGIPLYPVIGSASLPFRGGLTPNTVESFVAQYKGVRTTLIQSAFRYDYPLFEVKKAISRLGELLPKSVIRTIEKTDQEKIQSSFHFFEQPYRTTVEALAPIINSIASLLPRRRERVQHVGLFGYSRGVGKVKLPRAIGFTAAMYSIGLPPELIGTGRGLTAALKNGHLKVLEEAYPNIKADLDRAGRFFNKRLFRKILEHVPSVEGIREDIQAIESYLGHQLGPQSNEELEHEEQTSLIGTRFFRENLTGELLIPAAILRKSLG